MTATGMPAGIKVEVEFTAGAWTDVTSWLDQEPFTVKIGRTSEFSAPSVGTLDGVRLDNTDGRFTPQSQVLVDGSPHPYYPNVQPGRRIRYSNTPMGIRFVGKIGGKAWAPLLDGVGGSWVVLSADDRLGSLAKVDLRSPIAQAVRQDSPVLSWALTEPVGSQQGVEGHGGTPLTLGSGTLLAFGEPGPGVGDGTGVRFSPAAENLGQYLHAAVSLDLPAFTIECWVNAGTVLPAWSPQNILGLDGMRGMVYLINGEPSYVDGSFNSIIGSVSIVDGGWHHLAVTRATTGGVVTLWVDKVIRGTTGASSPTTAVTMITVGESAYGPSRFQGSIGYVGIYDRELTYASISAHTNATDGHYGERTSQRIARWLTAAGLTSADWSLPAGVAVVGTYPQDGKDVVSAAQDMVTTEGGGSVFYAAPDGNPTFVNRTYRKPGPPVLTLSATDDLDADAYGPSFDALTLVNSVKGTRAAASGTLSEQTWTDQASVGEFGPADDALTSYATTDTDVLHRTQSRAAGNAWPGFRLGQVGVDLATAANNLYAAAAAVRIGSRIRVGDLPAALTPATQVDVIAEGWTETVSTTSYVMTFDTSPADNPARAVWDDTTYGRWQCSGQSLNAALTSTATTVVIATGAGLPTFTMVGARYPVDVIVEREVITLTAAPNQSASPQSFASVLRGQAGTPAAPQASGATVQLSPSSTFTL